ncbi:MAG: cytochrome P450 [Paracoccaceae bacterium]
MTPCPIPVFAADTEFHQNLGLLKVAETAARQHGDLVIIRASDVRTMYLLGGSDSLQYWKAHQGDFQIELGAVASNAEITRILLGDQADSPGAGTLWAATAAKLSELNQVWDGWAHDALVAACKTLVSEIPVDGSPVDLRGLCRFWSLRAVCPVLFGDVLEAHEIADGLMLIEEFYFAMSTRGSEAILSPYQMPEFHAARDFLDRIAMAGINAMQVGDKTALAWMSGAIPETVDMTDRLACLRAVLGRMLLEKLNVDGLALMWTLVHLAQAPDVMDAIAKELEGRDIFALADQDSPLTWSVVQEGLRLYPELPFIYRTTSRDVQLGGATIPARSTVILAPWLLHRDTRYWPQPTHFLPARFLSGEANMRCFIPFGVGPRVRVRARFLSHQLVLAIRAVATHASLALAAECPRGNLRPILRSTLAPRGPVPVIFAPHVTTARQPDLKLASA